MAASWPTSVASDSTLYIAVNELQNNLSGAINSAVTTIGLNSTTSFPTVGLVLIDNEIIKYTGISGNNLTGCTRAFDGTTAASHSSAAVVSFAFCAAHHNNLKDEIIALETSLNLTASKALSTDTNGRVAVATTTLAELNFVAGVTSAIQTQLNAKAPTASPTFSGTITTPLTASRALVTGASNELAVSATTAAELAFVSGVTSAIQTQLNAKVSSKVLQTVAATGVTTTSTSSGTFVDTVITASIILASSSSKVLVFAGIYCAGSGGAGGARCRLKRDSTGLGDSSGTSQYANPTTTTGGAGMIPITWLDSPATSGSVTYTVQVLSDGGTQNVGNGRSWSIVLMEVL